MTKICNKCNLEKGLVDFYRNCHTKDGYRSDCKPCHTVVVRQYQSTDRGRVIAKQVDVKRIGTAARKASHNQASARYKKTPKGRLVTKACDQRRRELKANLDSIFSSKDIETVYKRFFNECFVCNAIDNLSIDHHNSLSGGNRLSHENAVLLCTACNSSKGIKAPEEFYSKEQLEMLNGFGII